MKGKVVEMGFNTNRELARFFTHCKDCPRRTVACHSFCEFYKNDKEEYEKYKQEKKKARGIFEDFTKVIKDKF